MLKNLLILFGLTASLLPAQTLEFGTRSNRSRIDTFLQEQKREPSRKDAFVEAGDLVIPQIANGGTREAGVFTEFQIFNVTDSSAGILIEFLDGVGNPTAFPVRIGSGGGAPENASILEGEIPARGMAFVTTVPDGAGVKSGWAIVTSVPGSAIPVVATFNQAVPGRPLFQASVPISSGIHKGFTVPFRNIAGFTGTLAVTSILEQNVLFIARNEQGTELCRTTRPFSNKHMAFVIRDLLPCTAGLNGTLELHSESQRPTLSGIGFTANDQGAFVTQPVYEENRFLTDPPPPPASELPGIAFSCGAVEGGNIWAHNGVFLGKITANRFDQDSIANEFGPYGSQYQPNSIFNQFGKYGSSFSQESPFNPLAQSPPVVYIDQAPRAYLTLNTQIAPRIDPNAVVACVGR